MWSNSASLMLFIWECQASFPLTTRYLCNSLANLQVDSPTHPSESASFFRFRKTYIGSYKGHKCRCIGQNLQPFTGNGDVSKWVKNSLEGRKTPNKRTSTLIRYVLQLRSKFILILWSFFYNQSKIFEWIYRFNQSHTMYTSVLGTCKRFTFFNFRPIPCKKFIFLFIWSFVLKNYFAPFWKKYYNLFLSILPFFCKMCLCSYSPVQPNMNPL